MKKFIAIILAAMMVLSFAACAKESETPDLDVKDETGLSVYIIGSWYSHVSGIKFNADGTGTEYGDDDGPGHPFTYTVNQDKVTIDGIAFTVVTGKGRDLGAEENFGIGGAEDTDMLILYKDNGECDGAYWRAENSDNTAADTDAELKTILIGTWEAPESPETQSITVTVVFAADDSFVFHWYEHNEYGKYEVNGGQVTLHSEWGEGEGMTYERSETYIAEYDAVTGVLTMVYQSDTHTENIVWHFKKAA